MMTFNFAMFYLVLNNVKGFSFMSPMLSLDNNIGFIMMLIPLTMLILFCSNYQYYYNNKNMKTLWMIMMTLIVGSFSTTNFFYFIIFLEWSIIPAALLMMIISKDKDKLESTILMVVMNASGSIGFLMFLYTILKINPSLSMNYHNLSQSYSSSSFLFFGSLFILLSKLPVSSLHFWLTKAHVSAATVCSIFLASIMLKLGSMGLHKIKEIYNFMYLSWSSLIVLLSVFGSVLFCLTMFRFIDTKHFIAVSSIVHMGPIFFMMASSMNMGVCSSFLSMVAHGIASSMLFIKAGYFYELNVNRSSTFTKSILSLSKLNILTLLVFVLLNSSLPPFIGFLSELLYLMSVISYSTFPCLLAFMGIFLFIVVSMMFFYNMLFGKKLSNSPENSSPVISMLSFMMMSYYFIIYLFFCSPSL